MIKVGEKIPSTPLKILTPKGIEDFLLLDHIQGKKVILFAVPGAFTPTCSNLHLPSFVKNAPAIMAKGIDEIICVAVNDPYVLDVWGRVTHAHGKVTLLSDGNGDFTKHMGMLLDATDHGLGLRSQRYVALVDNGIVKSLQVESDPASCTITCADEIVKLL
jgi:peroxiredoxin